MANNAKSDYLGSGLALPLRQTLQGRLQFTLPINSQGNLALSVGDRNIQESIWIILGTKLGERVYRPNFGSRLSELVFAPMSTQTLLLIRLYVREALEMWEPRILLQDVLTEPNPIKGQVLISIQYHIKETYDPRSLVYPFYLMPSS
ncbi:GPW/gp25 family protein [Phormidesmis sp. 146-12]